MKDGLSSVQHGIGKDGDVVCWGKYAGLSGHASQHTGILVINFSLNDAVAERAVIDCGQNRRSPSRRRIESCVGHAQWAEYLALAESVKRFVRNAFERNSKNDKTDVTVGGLGAWIRYQRHHKG